MYYGPNIIKQAGLSNGNLLNIGIGFFNFVFTIFAVFLVDRLGRRPLMLGGTSIMSVALLTIGTAYVAIPKTNQVALGIVVACGLILFLAGFEGGPGCLFWVLVNENFPEEHPGYKEHAATYANVLQWVFNLALSLVFPYLEDYPASTFFFFGGVGILSTIYLFFFMKETGGNKNVGEESIRYE